MFFLKIGVRSSILKATQPGAGDLTKNDLDYCISEKIVKRENIQQPTCFHRYLQLT